MLYYSEGWVTLRLNFTLKDYVSANIYGPLDGGMVILQLYRWKFSHKKNFVADFVQLNLNFIQKTTKIVFEPPFGGLRGNVALYL